MPPRKTSRRTSAARPRRSAAARVGPVAIGPGRPLALIAGPCVLETEPGALALARELAQMARDLGAPMIFKASFDKANRTSLASFRGPGRRRGLAILARIRERTGLPVLTDVHSVEDVEEAAPVVDALQIPAFLCRQTDLIVAAASSGRAVNIKKGQFLAPEDVRYLLEKAYSTGNRNIVVTERGTSFGYHRLVVDFCSLPTIRALGVPVVFDATHSVQTPGGEVGRSGGRREMVPYLARAAAAVGTDALFFEVHRRPDRARSDGPNSVRPSDLESLWPELVQIDALTRGGRE